MGSRSHRRLGRQARRATALRLAAVAFPLTSLGGAALVVATFGARSAVAQGHPDAGAARSAAPPVAERPSMLKSIPNPALLSESVRAQLQERAAARHPSQIAADEPAAPAPSSASIAAQGARQHAVREALERHGGQPRRVQALDTGNGITVLSNRVGEAPAPRLASLAPSAPSAPEPGAIEPEERAYGDDDSRVTETRSLRALSSRPEVPKAREQSLGADWLLWPFVLLLAIGAVVGTLWFSKKTE